jgi:DNA-binding NarL/FixJ family response regulator
MVGIASVPHTSSCSFVESTHGGTTVRVLIADDDSKVRAALRLLLEELSGQNTGRGSSVPCWTIAEAWDSASALGLLREDAADVVLLDWELPGIEPEAMILAARECGAGTIVAMSGRPEARRMSLECGADSFISKNEPPDLLVGVLRNRTHGGWNTA